MFLKAVVKEKILGAQNFLTMEYLVPNTYAYMKKYFFPVTLRPKLVACGQALLVDSLACCVCCCLVEYHRHSQSS